MNIAIIGTGNVGGTLGCRWARNGHAVVFGSRNPNSEKTRVLLENAAGNASSVSPEEAAANAEVIVLAVPWGVAQATIKSLGDLRNKILVDCTNPIAPGLKLAVDSISSGGELVANWASEARVVKAFNATGWENMADPIYQGNPSMMPICGDDDTAKSVVTGLAQELGFEVFDLGSLDAARLLEPFALVWIRLAMIQGLGRDIAFRLVKR
jgi:NADPH-dependent F420 reductase